MGKLIYMMNTSLDGYIEDVSGDFTWGAPRDEEIQRWLHEYVSRYRVLLYGRRLYEMMVYWETSHTLPNQQEFEIEFARRWQAAEKIVYSKTLTGTRSGRTRIEREFDVDAVRRMKAETDGLLGVGGPELAALAMSAGLIDEVQVRICPVVVGGGKRFLPDGVRLDLELLEEKRFGCGDLFLRYGVRKS